MEEERSFLILKRKLATLKYTDHLDVSSCALVDRLVDDLIRTSESYQSLKVHEHQKQLEASAFQSKVLLQAIHLCYKYGCIEFVGLCIIDLCCRQML